MHSTNCYAFWYSCLTFSVLVAEVTKRIIFNGKVSFPHLEIFLLVSEQHIFIFWDKKYSLSLLTKYNFFFEKLVFTLNPNCYGILDYRTSTTLQYLSKTINDLRNDIYIFPISKKMCTINRTSIFESSSGYCTKWQLSILLKKKIFWSLRVLNYGFLEQHGVYKCQVPLITC